MNKGMSSCRKIVTVDGSILEGGGQILRVSMALAGLLSVRMVIEKIRANRPKPGLAAQHLTSVNASCAVVGGCLEGNEMRSTKLSFTPLHMGSYAQLSGNMFTFAVDTAGAVSLVVQAMLPAFLLASRDHLTVSSKSINAEVIGGTNVAFSPPIDHTIRVLLPLLIQMGIPQDTRIETKRRGWNPKGQGVVRLESSSNTNSSVLKQWAETHTQESHRETPGVPAKENEILPELTGLRLLDAGSVVSVCGTISSSNNDIALMRAARDILLAGLREATRDFPSGISIDIGIDMGNTHCSDSSCSSSDATSVNSVVTQPVAPSLSVFESAVASANSGSSGEQRNMKGKYTRKKGGKGNSLVTHNTSNCELCIQLCAVTSTGCRLSRNILQRVKNADAVNSVCLKLISSLQQLIRSGATVDEHTADQLLIYMALAQGPSQVIVEPYNPQLSSQHIDTTVHVLETFFNLSLFNVRMMPERNNCRMIMCKCGDIDS